MNKIISVCGKASKEMLMFLLEIGYIINLYENNDLLFENKVIINIKNNVLSEYYKNNLIDNKVEISGIIIHLGELDLSEIYSNKIILTDYLSEYSYRIIYLTEHNFDSILYLKKFVLENEKRILNIKSKLLGQDKILDEKLIFLNFISTDIISHKFLLKTELKELSILNIVIIYNNIDDYIVHLENEYDGIISLKNLSNNRLNKLFDITLYDNRKKLKKIIRKYEKFRI